MTAPVVYRIEDLLRDPELLVPPPAVLPRLAWAGRLTLLAAPEKSGKSTLTGQAVAELVNGREFLGEATHGGVVLILALDEPLGDVVRRLASFGAERGVLIVTERLSPDELEAIIREHQVVLLIVDTLSEWASGAVVDFNSAADWTPVLGRLRRMLLDLNVAAILLHHSTKDGQRYRDSTQLGAGVDVILEMKVDEADPTVRRIRARGRVPVADFALRYADCRYHLEEGELPLEMRVYRVIEAEPGIAMGRLRARVLGSNPAIDAALADLVRKGAIEDRGSARGRAYFAVPLENAGQAPGKGPGNPPLPQLSDAGQGGGKDGARSEATPLARPPIRGGSGQGKRGTSESTSETPLNDEEIERLAIASEGEAA